MLLVDTINSVYIVYIISWLVLLILHVVFGSAVKAHFIINIVTNTIIVCSGNKICEFLKLSVIIYLLWLFEFHKDTFLNF